jgi:nucleotide-binding universal stress UspA family protein
MRPTAQRVGALCRVPEQDRCLSHPSQSGPWALSGRAAPLFDRVMRNPRSSPPELPGEDDDARPGPRRDPTETAPSAVDPIHVPPLLPRRHPWLVVEVDGSTATQGALAWALREAARREATVLAVTVPAEPPPNALGAGTPVAAREQGIALRRLEARVLSAIAETGVHGRVRTAVLERPVLEALTDAACGADLVIVGTAGKTVLRPAVARHPVRRLPRGA